MISKRSTGLVAALLLSLALTGCGATSPRAADVEATPETLGPGLELVTLDGDRLALDTDLKAGRPVVLVFWQTWCRPCAAEAPALVAAAKRYEGRLRFVGIVPGTDQYVKPDEVRRTAQKWGLPYVQVRDADLALSEALDVEGTPTILVISTEGKVLYKAHEPPADWDRFLPR